MRLDIRYRSVFAYTEDVSESHNELRACPLTDEYQRLLEYRVTIDPSARVYSYVDSWGTRVDTFGVRADHSTMVVTAEAAVETSLRPLPIASTTMADLSGPSFIDAHIEYLERDRHTDGSAEVSELALRQAKLGGPDVVGAALAIHRFVGSHLRYAAGSTSVGIEVNDVLKGGVGVCQDFAHLTVTMCRAVGIPARYVSGYLFTTSDAEGIDTSEDMVLVETHAWVEVAVPGWGWLALDPTNGQSVGERHVKIGHGRSYDDVQPLRGVFLGPAQSTVVPQVEIRRLSAGSSRLLGSAAEPGLVPVDLVTIARKSQPQGISTIQQQQQQQQQQ
ncbi:MAG: transglutaminase family protein [Microthrixaceae bacterium]